MVPESPTDESDAGQLLRRGIIGAIVLVAIGGVLLLRYTVELFIWGQLVSTVALVALVERKGTVAGELTE